MVLLIGGHPRSGTTMLWRLCSRHPDIELTNEFGVFRTLNVPLSLYTVGIVGRMWYRRNRPVLFDPETGTMDNPRESRRWMWTFLRGMRERRPALVDETDVEAVLRSRWPTARVVGDKYPNYALTLPAYVGLDGVCPVVIYRDARDVTASYLEQWRIRGRREPVFGAFETAEKIARHWVRAVRIMQRHEGRTFTIRYETFVREPRPALERLAERLGVDPDGFPVDLPHADSVGRYVDRLTPEEIEAVERAAGPVLAELGYV